MEEAYFPILLTILVGLGLSLAIFAIGHYWGPKNATPEKMIPYECGSDTTGTRGVRLSMKFFVTAILFVVFDIEIVFLYPWAARFGALGTPALIAMLGFIAALGTALLYVVGKGALKWEE